jgi:hypothetical protein
VLRLFVDKRKKDCRHDDDGDDNVGKNQSGSEEALATISRTSSLSCQSLLTLD